MVALLRRQATSRSRGRVSRTASAPAPIGGWNRRDGLDTMQASDAVKMENWFPDFGAARLRRGYSEFVASGMGSGNVDTLMEYHVGSTREFYACANGNIYDITSGTASSDVSGLSENRWEWLVFDGKLGMVNGTDTPRQYNGTSWSTLTVTGPSNPVGIAAFRSRTYFWDANSQSIWYSALNTLGGSVTEFDLSRVPGGAVAGNVTFVASWSLGGGSDTWGGGGSVQDVLVIGMSSGDVIVYEGSDPGADFVLIGVYRIGAPLDVRGHVKVGDDLVIITRHGALPMSQVLRQGNVVNRAAVSDKIRDAFIDAGREYAANTGWQAEFYPQGNWLICNIPVSSTRYDQYVANVATGAWCQFTNMNARCWTVYNNELYFGTTDGKVMKADTGTSDNGSNIGGTNGAEVRTAYIALGARGALQHVKMVRPVLSGTGDLSLGFAVESDFSVRATNEGEVSFAANVSNWEDIDDDWDQWGDDWEAGNAAAFGKWVVRNAKGYRFNLRILANVQESVEWFSTEFMFETGQGL